MSVSVRRAVGSDVDVIGRLRESSVAESVKYRGHLDPDGKPSEHAVAEVSGETVGVIGWVDEATVRTISVVHVHPDARGIGAGDALVAWVIADATAKGLRSLRGQALPGDRETKNLFERNGLVARAIQVERNLG